MKPLKFGTVYFTSALRDSGWFVQPDLFDKKQVQIVDKHGKVGYQAFAVTDEVYRITKQEVG